jgi:hypothetical protein
MVAKGKAMLVTFMDIDPADEDDFNLWFDREHLAHRVSIPGFLEASRYVATQGSPKYFSTYFTDEFDVLTSPAYKEALANQTPWSLRNIPKFKGMGRAIVHVTAASGDGRGGVLGVVRIRPKGDFAHLREEISSAIEIPQDVAGLTTIHLIESDPALSKSLTHPDAVDPGAADWYILIEGTSLKAVSAAVRTHAKRDGTVSTGTFNLMWNVTRRDLGLAAG